MTSLVISNKGFYFFMDGCKLDALVRHKRFFFRPEVVHIATMLDFAFYLNLCMDSTTQLRPCGLMDKASDFGSEDCRFESCQGR